MDATENTRARALIAIGALVALVVLVVVVLLGSGEGEREFAAAPDECVERWNQSEDALATGRHNSGSHGYFQVQVAYATEDGSAVSPDPVEDGGCIVIFAASQLDPEPVAAAEINAGRSWAPLSATAETSRLAELQSQALGEHNAELGQDGAVTALSEGAA